MVEIAKNVENFQKKDLLEILRHFTTCAVQSLQCVLFPGKSPIQNGNNELEIYIYDCIRSGIRHESTHLLQNVCIEVLFLSSGRLKNQNPYRIRHRNKTEM